MDFLSQAYHRNWEIFEAALRGSSSVPHWDVCVLTAANERQARAYEMQLEMRRRIGALPPNSEWIVVPDPDGARIGSGGATLNVLLQVLKALAPEHQVTAGTALKAARLLRGKRILVVHSGGDSRRLPQYSAFGKLFASVPRELPDGRASTLFDEFIVSLSGIPLHMHEGIVIASGDVLLVFDHMQLDLARQGVVGVAMRVPPEVGTRHGVYVSDAGSKGRVRQFLHKPGLSRIEETSAVGSDGRVAVDTGIVWMDPDVAATCVAMAGVVDNWAPDPEGMLSRVIREQIPLNLYGDIIGPLAEETSREAYLLDQSDAAATPEMQAVRARVWEELRGTPLSVQSLHPARFVHFGSTLEYREAMHNGAEMFGEAASTSRPLAHISSASQGRIAADVTLSHTLVGGMEGRVARGSVIENSLLQGPVSIGHGCLVSCLQLDGEGRKFSLKDNLVLHMLPVITGEGEPSFVARIYGVADNPKLAFEKGNATFLNQPLRDWLSAAGLSEADLWQEGEEHTLWTARLYPACETEGEALAFATSLQTPERIEEVFRATWRRMPRLSLKESYERADLQRILDRLVSLEDEIRADRFIDAASGGTSSATLTHVLGERQELAWPRVERTVQNVEVRPSLIQMHVLKGLSDVMGRLTVPGDREGLRRAERLEDQAFVRLSKTIQEGSPADSVKARPASVDPITVRASAPARIDFGGGWSDTPPYSIENGGTVLNAAISLNGRLPICAEARHSNDGLFHLESVDLGVSRVYTSEELQDYDDLSDPLALHKAALVLTGLDRMDGVSLSLTSEVNIPKGSGLGTSSIMAGAVLAALNRLAGREATTAELFDQVLCLEQMLTTGGGWQDQVGGIVGGLKLVTTKPGMPQVPEWEPVPVPNALHDHLVLVYTGQRRLAKRILRTIMGRYLSWDPQVVSILSEIQHIAREMVGALALGDMEEFGNLLSEHWEANKALDPGSTNPLIDHLFQTATPYVWGGKLAGAGGGGFAFMMAKSPEARKRLAGALEETYPEQEVRVWPCRIHEAGLELSVIEAESEASPSPLAPL